MREWKIDRSHLQSTCKTSVKSHAFYISKIRCKNIVLRMGTWLVRFRNRGESQGMTP